MHLGDAQSRHARLVLRKETDTFYKSLMQNVCRLPKICLTGGLLAPTPDSQLPFPPPLVFIRQWDEIGRRYVGRVSVRLGRWNLSGGDDSWEASVVRRLLVWEAPRCTPEHVRWKRLIYSSHSNLLIEDENRNCQTNATSKTCGKAMGRSEKPCAASFFTRLCSFYHANVLLQYTSTHISSIPLITSSNATASTNLIQQ